MFLEGFLEGHFSRGLSREEYGFHQNPQAEGAWVRILGVICAVTNKQTNKQTNKKAAKPEFKNIHIVRQSTTSQLPAHQNSLMAARAIPLSAYRLGPPSSNKTRK